MYFIARLLKALNSESQPWQIAMAIALGMVIGLTPTLRLHNLFIVLVVMMFRINLSSFLVAWALFSGLAIVFQQALIDLGHSILTDSAMEAWWTALYNTGIGQLSQFNHTLTAGGLALGLVLFIPVFYLARYLVISYREKLMTWVNKLKIVEFLKSSRLFQIYQELGAS